MLFSLPTTHYVGAAVIAFVYMIRTKLYKAYESLVKHLHSKL